MTHAVLALRDVSDTADLDARILLEHSLSKDHAWLLAHRDDAIDGDALDRYKTLVRKRRSRTPVAYITGWKEFWSLRLGVDNSVLVPRPETEHLVDQALRLIPDARERHVADLGTGSGAVALAIASERPSCRVTATDVSAAALRVAQSNGQLIGVGNVVFVCADWLSALSGTVFDLIVSNPPYIAEDDPCLRQAELLHEPAGALKSGPGGLDALRMIGSNAVKHLRAGGWLVVEHGYDQREEVAKIFAQGGLQRISCRCDHAGHPRITAGQAPASGTSTA